MRKLALLAGILAAVLGAPAAHANPPVIFPAPGTNFIDTTSCAFPVSITYVVNGETAKVFSDGSVLVTGPLAATFSANGKSVTLNISGPLRITSNGEFIGHGLGAGPLQTATGVTLAYTTGIATINPETGVATLLHGTMLLDICAALAS